MSESERVKELEGYRILDTLPEKEFDDIVRMTSSIFETPVSVISFVDSQKQWFKAKVGMDISETSREDSFCKYSLHNPDEVLVINDTLCDDRFKDNPMVTGNPNIRFYAGSPITTSKGNVLGSLCIIDHKPREINEFQLHTLKVLANKVMKLIDERLALLTQEIAIVKNEDLIEKISDHSPGALFKFMITNEGDMCFPFVSKGISNIHPGLTPEMLKNDAVLGFNTIHPEDLPKVYESIGNSFKTLTNLDFEFRITADDGSIKWHRAKANPEKREDCVVWYGTLQDVTESKEYIETLEEIMFSISHIIRKPVTTMLGLVQVLNEETLSDEKIKELAGYFNKVAEEMDEYTQKLNDVFQEKKVKVISGKAH